jgi:hypothetical protein
MATADDPRLPDGNRVFDFAFDPAFRLMSAPFGVRPGRARVEVDPTWFRAVFGPWSVTTPRGNVAGACATGPYATPKVMGPARLSLRDRGLTFATNARAGACVRFHEPVAGITPFGWVRHPALTVTVADVAGLVALLDPLRGHPSGSIGSSDPDRTS